MSFNFARSRGSQINVGGLSIQIPQRPPKDDDECLHAEDTIALIERQIAPYKEIVDKGRKVQDGLQEDITRARLAMLQEKEPIDPDDFPLHAEWCERQETERQERERAAAKQPRRIPRETSRPLVITADAGKEAPKKAGRGRKRAS